ncbi:hypothetical protein, partial [Thermoflexus hugenholtzii]
ETVFQEILRQVRGALGLGPAQRPLPVFPALRPTPSLTPDPLLQVWSDLTRTMDALQQALWRTPRDPVRIAQLIETCRAQLEQISEKLSPVT